ncbi:hypothetical protein ANN_25195 [Periplaneta americana]|uniref:DUF4817 domain-containing protein n=1 Tax=Periplaneta americana TaxID=6978 RepID=A0ABQ8S0W5_PERAM|nr:hypothetical protein ANN_25195 [Periplaneta americana]
MDFKLSIRNEEYSEGDHDCWFSHRMQFRRIWCWSGVQRAFIVETFLKNEESVIATRTHFDIGCHARIPTRNTILRWVASFRITGSTLKKKSPGRNSIALRLSEATVRCRGLGLLSLGPFEGYNNKKFPELWPPVYNGSIYTSLWIGVLYSNKEMKKRRSDKMRFLSGVAGHNTTDQVTNDSTGQEHRLRVFENNDLSKIFGAKRDEVTGEWRKLHNTELQALYSSPDIIRNIKSRHLRWAGHVARMGESRNARPEGKRPLGRPRRRWEDNIKTDLRELGYDDREWINLAYVRAAMNFRRRLWRENSVTTTTPQSCDNPTLATVRSVPGRSLDGTRCRHGCPETETLAHVLGFCEQGLLLRNSRHHLVRSKIAAALRNKGWIVAEEISCLAENGSTRRVDILAYNADTKQGIIVDTTIRLLK